MNPFQTWADLTSGLKDRLIQELGQNILSDPYAGELVGSLAGLITHVRHIGTLIERLRRNHSAVYDALNRALERSGENEVE